MLNISINNLDYVPNSSLLAIFDIIDLTAIIDVLWNNSIIPPEKKKNLKKVLVFIDFFLMSKVEELFSYNAFCLFLYV